MKRNARWLAICIVSLIGTAGLVWGDQEVATPGKDVTMPRIVRQVKPEYTLEARKQGIQGVVILSVVVKDDGTVGDVTVKQSLDDKFGLDDRAVIAMRKWQFTPGIRNGKPVAVRVDVEMSFTLK